MKHCLFCCLIGCVIWGSGRAQETNCKNLGFEFGNFANWTGYEWVYSTSRPSKNTPRAQISLPSPRRHVIMTNVNAYDENTGNALRKIPKGYLYSARLGDGFTNADASFRCWQQSLRYTMTIDSTNALLVMKFALVLQYAKDHSAEMEPRFRVQLYDQNGDTIPDCANYDVFASNANVKGFHSYQPNGAADPIIWRDWTTVGVNLLKYIGQSISVEFLSTDCTGNFHFGYAYFVAECHPLYITLKYCAGDSVAVLTAPEGFEKYQWMDKSGAVVDSSRVLSLPDPDEGATYSCNLTSETGCTVSLQSTIAKYILKADFSSAMIDCKSNRVRFTNLSTVNQGTLSYKWHFGDGNTSDDENPDYKFQSSGMHQVILELTNSPSSCSERISKTIESFSPPLVGITGDSTYCPGGSTWLRAYGAFDYTWSNGSKADSIIISEPGGKFWLLGRSSTGCVSDTILRDVIEEPEWKFQNEGDTTLCSGQNVELIVTPASKYLWNTNDTTGSILVSSPGIYSVMGTNSRGCRKSANINVVEYPLPQVGFSITGSPVDKRHSQVGCSIPVETDVHYVWDMGDGSSETGPTVQHTYNINKMVSSFLIKLTATTKYGCSASSEQAVDVVPFVPNVFSPNGDGINDLFMQGAVIEVFDRNGMKLYSGNEGWDGTFNGRNADPDTYFYLVSFTDRFQQVQKKKGYITLVR